MGIKLEEKVTEKKELEIAETLDKSKKRDIFYDEVELALSESLGRKIQITAVKDKGSIKIEFFDKEDLQKLIKLFD